MPRIAGISGPYWFYFYSFDCAEPMHVHVRRDDKDCKFWLEPTQLAWNHKFTARELNEIRRIIQENQSTIIEAWHEHCDHD